MSATNVQALVERIEALSGADRETDCLIRELIDPRYRPTQRVMYYGEPSGEHVTDDGHFAKAPAYTASLDAALSLLPESDAATAVFWKVGNDGEGGDPALFKATILVAHVLASKTSSAVADTASLALTSAALKARAAIEGEG